jgi:hypothetical protein
MIAKEGGGGFVEVSWIKVRFYGSKSSNVFYPRKPKNYVQGNDIPLYMHITVKKKTCYGRKI